jgi:hypothetical protein
LKVIKRLERKRLKNGYYLFRRQQMSKEFIPLLLSLRMKNSKVETIVQFIVQFIERNDLDLVVTGSKGLSQFKQMLVGSKAYGIISHSKCPVLIIR